MEKHWSCTDLKKFGRGEGGPDIFLSSMYCTDLHQAKNQNNFT